MLYKNKNTMYFKYETDATTFLYIKFHKGLVWRNKCLHYVYYRLEKCK